MDGKVPNILPKIAEAEYVGDRLTITGMMTMAVSKWLRKHMSKLSVPRLII